MSALPLELSPSAYRFSAVCQRCHLTYDGEHHARNAARSRAARATAGMEPLL